MEEVTLNEAESRYFSDLFVCCDVEKTGKIPVLKATELFRSANLSNDAIRQITSIAGIPQTAIHISRSQFYSCLKLIAAYQASITPLRSEIISSSISLPLPRFSWKEDLPSLLPPRRQSSAEISSGISNSNATLNKLASSSNSSVSGASGGAGGSTSSLIMDSNGLVTINNETRAKQRDNRSPSLVGLNRATVITAPGGEKASIPSASELLSTDSEVEHNDSGGRVNHRHRGGSPEAWSTNSDSPTPTNSVAERPWAKETLWQGLLGDEHRQLLGTEEESSDRHSSDEDNETDLETIFQISNEQKEYYHKQFKVIQPDPNGLVSGHIARVFFEKSRIPVEELRHIWQLCDVTRDGALSLAEFTSAMHLVVLRRNNIPLPNILPQCLHPTILSSTSMHTQQNEPPEADLLHLDDDDSSSAKTSVVDGSVVAKSNMENKETVRKVSIDKGNSKTATISNVTQSASKIHDKSKAKSPTQPNKNRSSSNTPPAEPVSPIRLRIKELAKEWTNQNKEWTKFTESPTSNVSSPGPKPVNFDMQRTAQAVVSDPQILHPVPLRVTPVVGPEANDDELVSSRAIRKSENFVYDPASGTIRENESSPKQQQQQQHHHHSSGVTHHRESLQGNDLRAIQRPQAKKLPSKNIGAIPPPPQREPSIGSGSGGDSNVFDGSLPSTAGTTITASGSGIANVNNLPLPNKKEPPPLPPPRPRHARSSSLDLNKLKLTGNHPTQPEIIQQTSFDMQIDSNLTGFADFTHFPDTNKTRASAFEVYRKPNTPRNSQSPPDPQSSSSQYHQQHFQSLPPSVASSLQQQISVSGNCSSGITIPNANIGPGSTLSISGNTMPSTNSSNSSVSINTAALNTNSIDYEKRVMAISEQLRHVSLANNNSNSNNSINNKLDKNVVDILRHLREQNILLLRLCNDLSQELLQIQERKEEARCKLDSLSNVGSNLTSNTNLTNTGTGTVSNIQTGGISGSGNISTNVTGGSANSVGTHSNV
ncbi:ralBP1-associated Eps domain-containing protein 1 isoform X2 [Condylostylus longicornis]|uniref:ralBP1-associated Eps domain-containing protein 1 isoform X2 n=1 Tax=Condylostylus longicornis TaxID=2530218 RepID=UPI00244DB1D8|nr:ralBP1-associated Eps domain-containing protein 1 isoform X2 [Condylostylus longicornis]